MVTPIAPLLAHIVAMLALIGALLANNGAMGEGPLKEAPVS